MTLWIFLILSPDTLEGKHSSTKNTISWSFLSPPLKRIFFEVPAESLIEQCRANDLTDTALARRSLCKNRKEGKEICQYLQDHDYSMHSAENQSLCDGDAGISKVRKARAGALRKAGDFQDCTLRVWNKENEAGEEAVARSQQVFVCSAGENRIWL